MSPPRPSQHVFRVADPTSRVKEGAGHAGAGQFPPEAEATFVIAFRTIGVHRGRAILRGGSKGEEREAGGGKRRAGEGKQSPRFKAANLSMYISCQIR